MEFFISMLFFKLQSFLSKIHNGNVQLSWWFFRITFIEMAGAIIIHNLTWFFFIDWSHRGGIVRWEHAQPPFGPAEKRIWERFYEDVIKIKQKMKGLLAARSGIWNSKDNFLFFFSQIRRILLSFNSNSAGFAECWRREFLKFLTLKVLPDTKTTVFV